MSEAGRDPCIWIIGTWEISCYAAAHVSSCQVSWEGDEASSHRVYFQQEEEKDISGYYLDVFCKLKAPLILPSRVCLLYHSAVSFFTPFSYFSITSVLICQPLPGIDGSSVALGRSLHPNFSGFVAVLQDPGAIRITFIPLIESRIPNLESSRYIFPLPETKVQGMRLEEKPRRSSSVRAPQRAVLRGRCRRCLGSLEYSSPSQAIFPALPSAGGDLQRQGLLCGLLDGVPATWHCLGSSCSKSPPSSWSCSRGPCSSQSVWFLLFPSYLCPWASVQGSRWLFG